MFVLWSSQQGTKRMSGELVASNDATTLTRADLFSVALWIACQAKALQAKVLHADMLLMILHGRWALAHRMFCWHSATLLSDLIAGKVQTEVQTPRFHPGDLRCMASWTHNQSWGIMPQVTIQIASQAAVVSVAFHTNLLDGRPIKQNLRAIID